MSSSYPENLKEVRTARAGRLKHPILRFVRAFFIPTRFFLISFVIFFIGFILLDDLFAKKVLDWFFFLFLIMNLIIISF